MSSCNLTSFASDMFLKKYIITNERHYLTHIYLAIFYFFMLLSVGEIKVNIILDFTFYKRSQIVQEHSVKVMLIKSRDHFAMSQCDVHW